MLYGDECMGVPIEGGSLEIRRRVSIRTKPGMRLPLQVQVGMKRPVVQEKGFDAAGLAQGFLWWPLVQEGMQMGPQ